jgi:hypothetical protein
LKNGGPSSRPQESEGTEHPKSKRLELARRPPLGTVPCDELHVGSSGKKSSSLLAELKISGIRIGVVRGIVKFRQVQPCAVADIRLTSLIVDRVNKVMKRTTNGTGALA